MGNTTNAVRQAQLGMPWGTAAHRLRKMIMFRLMQKCGEDICFRCGLTIESVDEISIEHKLDWMNVDPALFWDLDNVTWSHMRCNRPNPDGPRTSGKHRRKVPPEGMAWCSYDCKAFRPIGEFWSSSNRWNGVAKRCKDCNNKSKVDYKVGRKKTYAT